jgi:hypothetical protein
MVSKAIAKFLTKIGASGEEVAHVLCHWGKLREPEIRETMALLSHKAEDIEKAMRKLKSKVSIDADKMVNETKNKVTQFMATPSTLSIPPNYTQELINRIKASGQSDLSAIASTLKSAGLSAGEVAAGAQAAGAATVHDTTQALMQAGFKAEEAVKTVSAVWNQPVNVAAQVLQRAGHDVQSAMGVLGTAFKGSEQTVANAVAQVFNPVPAGNNPPATSTALNLTDTAASLSNAASSAASTVANAASSAWHDVENWF